MTAFPAKLDQGWRRRVRSRILRWYGEHGRSLPWRQSKDAYRIWISEIMLQQTTVAAVVPFYDRFLTAFPTVQDLAAAEQDEVLRQWEGLGYYSRARNLHKAAKQLVTDFDGIFPETADELQQLPGIGPYTAGAISSFAFNQPAPIVEANTLRLYSRLMELDEDPRSSAGQKLLWRFAGWIVARKQPADFNQAVMDIGSQVCRPVDPDCRNCPLRASCKALEAQRQDSIPMEAKKTEFTEMTDVSIAVRRNKKWLIRQHTESERWAGLYDFVRFEIQDPLAKQIPKPVASKKKAKPSNTLQKSLFDDDAKTCEQETPLELFDAVEQRTGIHIQTYSSEKKIRHTVTRYKINLLCLQAEASGGTVLPESGYHWVSTEQLNSLPLSRTGRQFADHLLQSTSE